MQFIIVIWVEVLISFVSTCRYIGAGVSKVVFYLAGYIYGAYYTDTGSCANKF